MNDGCSIAIMNLRTVMLELPDHFWSLSPSGDLRCARSHEKTRVVRVLLSEEHNDAITTMRKSPSGLVHSPSDTCLHDLQGLGVKLEVERLKGTASERYPVRRGAGTQRASDRPLLLRRKFLLLHAKCHPRTGRVWISPGTKMARTAQYP
jgi:hypothetical protein